MESNETKSTRPTSLPLAAAFMALTAAVFSAVPAGCGDRRPDDEQKAKLSAPARSPRARLELKWNYGGPSPSGFVVLHRKPKGTLAKLTSVTALHADLGQKGAEWTLLLDRDSSAALGADDCVVVAALAMGGEEGARSPETCF